MRLTGQRTRDRCTRSFEEWPQGKIREPHAQILGTRGPTRAAHPQYALPRAEIEAVDLRPTVAPANPGRARAGPGLIAEIQAELGRGVSYWEAFGGYTGEQRTVVLCTFYRPQEAELKRIIARVDPAAFVNIGVTQQAMGQGFTEIRKSVG